MGPAGQAAQHGDGIGRVAAFKRQGALGKYRGLRISGIADLGFLAEFPLLLYLEVLDQKVAKKTGSSLVIGMAMGFLPCPLVYAGLAAAAASG